MARKNLLNIETPKARSADTPPAPAKKSRAGAIGAVSRSLADLKSRAITEVVADQIDAAGLQDRLDEDPDGLTALTQSIRDYGQQVPVMLRFSPNTEGRYEVIYGRRRVAALKALGLPVKAMIREISDRDLVVAQGQENNARKDLSYIEKANFARQMAELDFDRKVITDALHVDKTQVSRMLAVAETIPRDVITAIGAAPSVGRDRWRAFAEAWEKAMPRRKETLTFEGETSDARFDHAMAHMTRRARKPRAEDEVIVVDDIPIASVKRGPKGATLALTHTQDGFDQWLIDRLGDLHRQFQDGEDQSAGS